MKDHQRYIALALVTATLGVAVGERTALSVAGPRLMKELAIDTIELGWLLSAFAWSYVLAHLPAGLLVDRFGARRVVGFGVGACAGISLLTALAGLPWLAGSAFTIILLLRIALGILQASVGPSSGMALAAWFPASERGMAGAIYATATYVGYAVFAPVQGWIVSHWGWQAMFVFMALAGSGMAMWWRAKFHLPAQHPRLSAVERDRLERGGALINVGDAKGGTPGNRKAGVGVGAQLATQLLALCRNRMMLGILVAQYCLTVTTWFFVLWFPGYLVVGRGMSVAEAGAAAIPPALAGVIGGLCCGFYSDRLLRRTGSLSIARKRPVYLGMTLCSGAIVACLFVADNGLMLALMALAMFGKGFGTVGWTLVADVAPREQIGVTGALFNAIGNASGIVTPIAIGYLVAWMDNFTGALLFVALHGFVGIAAHVWMTGPLRRLDHL